MHADFIPAVSFIWAQVLKNFYACNFIKKEILAQVFSYQFCEILKNPFLKNTSGDSFGNSKLHN